MSNKEKRVLLEEEDLELVSGGNVKYVLANGEHYCYGSHNPDVKYEFQSARQCAAFIKENYDYYGEAGIFAAMENAGLITRMP